MSGLKLKDSPDVISPEARDQFADQCFDQFVKLLRMKSPRRKNLKDFNSIDKIIFKSAIFSTLDSHQFQLIPSHADAYRANMLESTLKAPFEIALPVKTHRDPLLNLEGGCATSTIFGKLADVSRETVNTWKEDQRIIATSGAKRGFLYPIWQIHESRLLPGLAEVIAHLVKAGEYDRGQMRWMLSPNTDLDGQRPLDLMRSGNAEQAIWAAKVLAAVRQ